ncbi:MAG: type II secretion system F family protein [Deltaproteobacteria bacterium]|nr:type II secretion system F family protein [Deltaproteobacteria bacterium]
MLYRYQAIGRSGRYVSGSAAAGSIGELRMDLARGGLSLVEARVDVAGQLLAALKPRNLPRDVMIDMFGFLRGLLGMGIDMNTAWNSVAEALPNQLAKETCSMVTHAVQQGHSLHESMSRAGVFPPMVLGNVKAGEQSGTLEKVFESLEEHYRQEQVLMQQVMKATMYPAISLGVLFMVGVGLLAGVVPQLKGIFPPNPPLPTKILLFLSDGVVDYWWTIPGFIGAVAFIWWRMPDGTKARVWEVFYRLPILGPVLKNVALTNVFQNMSLMLGAGMTLTTALDVAISSVTSRAVKVRLESILQSIQRGGTFSEGFQDPFFPPMAAGVLRQGEMMGKLDQYLTRLSTFLRDRTQQRLQTVATLIEPILLLVGGGMLMILAIGIFGPIYGSMKNGGR